MAQCHLVVEGDISQCFDRLDHGVLHSVLAENIHDSRFLRLIDGLLQAGYLEEWRYHETLSGAPQGGILSPLLSNIYLDRLDKYVETTLLPLFNQGTRRKPYLPYMGYIRPPGNWRSVDSGKKHDRCVVNCNGCPLTIPMIRASGGCTMSAMRTIGCWGSPGHDGKPSTSRRRSASSCGTV